MEPPAKSEIKKISEEVAENMPIDEDRVNNLGASHEEVMQPGPAVQPEAVRQPEPETKRGKMTVEAKPAEEVSMETPIQKKR